MTGKSSVLLSINRSCSCSVHWQVGYWHHIGTA